MSFSNFFLALSIFERLEWGIWQKKMRNEQTLIKHLMSSVNALTNYVSLVKLWKVPVKKNNQSKNWWRKSLSYLILYYSHLAPVFQFWSFLFRNRQRHNLLNSQFNRLVQFITWADSEENVLSVFMNFLRYSCTVYNKFPS